MSYANLLIANANPDFKFILVRFTNDDGNKSKPYMYKTLLDVEVGQQVVVDSPTGVAIVEVFEVTPAIECDHEAAFRIKWIVSVVDRAHYNDCVEMEKVVLGKVNKMQAKKKQQALLVEMEETFGKDEIGLLTTTILTSAAKPDSQEF